MNDGGNESEEAPDEDARGLTEAECLDWLWRRRYSADGVTAECPRCRMLARFHRLRGRHAYACDRCGHQLYPTADTPFNRSRTALSAWFLAARLVIESGGSVAATELQRRCGLEYRTALRVKKRLTRALAEPTDAKLLHAAAEWLFGPLGRRRGPLEAHAEPGAQERIDAILTAACRTFAHRGLGTTRIADIAAEAHVSSAVIRYHFRTKNQLLLAALTWAEERSVAPVLELLRVESDHLRRLRGMVELAVPTPGVLQDDYLLWLEFWVWTRQAPQQLMDSKVLYVFHDALLRVIRAGEAAGAFRLARTPEDIADSFIALSDGLSYKTVQGYPDMPVTRAQELLWAFATQQLGVTEAPAENPKPAAPRLPT